MPRFGGFPETMHAIYRKTCLVPIADRIAQGKLKVSDFYAQMQVWYLGESEIIALDPDLRSFINLNTPDGIAAANPLDAI